METNLISKAVIFAVFALKTGAVYSGTAASQLNLDQDGLGISIPAVSKDYVEPSAPVEWVTINGGTFNMGTDSREHGLENAKPVHMVAIRTFDMSKTAVTVDQYAECVMASGGCTKPATGGDCNWGQPGRGNHPVNCVSWDQANKYAEFKGARLPSESEWEYAATSGGKNQKYPWGNDEPTCEKAVISSAGGTVCAKSTTMPVCSTPAGNTADGLCDMAGNVWQWTQDWYDDLQASYKGTPVDGRAFDGAGSYSKEYRVLRGGSYLYNDPVFLRTSFRIASYPGRQDINVGFRIVR